MTHNPEHEARRARIRLQALAKTAVRRAIYEGRLPLPASCEACGATDPRPPRCYVYHHHSYAPEHLEDVIPMCRACHGRVHAGTLAEPRTGRLYEKPPGLQIGFAIARANRARRASGVAA